MAPWNKKRDLGGIRSSEEAESWPEKLTYLEAIQLVEKAGYEPKGRVLSEQNNSIGTVYEHEDHADLLVNFKRPDGKSTRYIEDTYSSTAYHNQDNPVKGNPDDKGWDEEISEYTELSRQKKNRFF